MGWRSVIISKPAKLSVKHRQLLLQQDEGNLAALPLEDLSTVVLDTPQVLLTGAVLSELATHGVALVCCDAEHHPNGVLLPFLAHSRTLNVMQKQLALSVPQKKRVWQTIVRQKLRNQSSCLERHRPGKGKHLANLATKVRSGDPDNREASAAQYYFSELFGAGFTRTRQGWYNSALNYGYAILRAAIARGLVAHGFLPPFGLQHKSQLNSFNLADDLIEVLRPVVDNWVVAQADRESPQLLKADKAGLVQLLYADVAMRRGNMNVLSAIEYMVEGLGRYCDSASLEELDWPTLLE